MNTQSTHKCQFFVSISTPECGEPGPHTVRVRAGRDESGSIIYRRVHLCHKHKATHDETFANIRAAKRKEEAQRNVE